MRYCPRCRTEYREGFAACADCGASLVEKLPAEAPPADWVPVFRGESIRSAAVREDLRARGLDVEEVAVESWPLAGIGVVAGVGFTVNELRVPPDQAQRFAAEIQAAIGDYAGPGGSADLEVEAEQDFDVRGCAACGVFLHDWFETCPGCGKELVPAVDVMEPEATEPGPVILYAGTVDRAHALAEVLAEQGFTPEEVQPAGWRHAALRLPWRELIERTNEVEAAVAPHRAWPSR